MEVLQILKYLYRQERLDFSSGWVSKPDELRWIPTGDIDTVRGMFSNGEMDELVDMLNMGVAPPAPAL
jgi:hypothetical protein